MRRATKVAWRLGWRLAVAGVAVVGIVLLASLGGVDRAPHPGSDYAVRTEARLR
ncbi:MAG: hypothetical protein IT580_24140, partial [Verrucomicrobiales bacterium]|nr:hypothetical protein [Verrucomicrobiales bacterium]